MYLEKDVYKRQLLGDMINETAESMLGHLYEYELFEEGIHSIFVRGHMPAVYVGQKDEAYECGSPFDLSLIHI